MSRLGRHLGAAERIAAALETLGADRLDADVAALNGQLGRVLAFAGEYERAGPALEAALDVAEALELPAVMSEALNAKGVVYESTDRPQQARYLYAAAIDIAAHHHGLTDELARAQSNAGNMSLQWDVPDARRYIEASVAVNRRRGDRYGETVNTGNLMSAHLLAGRWDETERLGAEFLGEHESRPNSEYLYLRLGFLQSLRGEHNAARASLSQIEAWEHTDSVELRADLDAARIAFGVAEGRYDEALEHGLRMLGPAIDSLGVAHESVRDGWPEALAAALALNRIEDARRLMALLADRPTGHIPPYLGAQLARGRGLLHAAEGDHDDVERDLQMAIGTFEKLGYPYWLAVAQTDLAAWLIGESRASEAAPLLDEAADTLESLGATPALARVQELSRSLTGAIAT